MNYVDVEPKHLGGGVVLFENTLLYKLNKMLPPDIVFHKVVQVEDMDHARFVAHYRAYNYHIGAKKNPFNTDTVYHFPLFNKLDKDKMQAAAKLLLEYKAFAPFCKSHSDAKTMNCDLYQSEWSFEKEEEMILYNRRPKILYYFKLKYII